MATILALECPKCGEEKHMALRDYEYRDEKQIGINCVHCDTRNEVTDWEEIGRHD